MNKKIFSLIIFVVIFTAGISNSQTITDTIRLGTETGQDCMVFSINQSVPYPDLNDLIAFAWTFDNYVGIGRSYFKFNLVSIPTTSNVISAKLSLFANHYTSSANHYGLNETYLKKVITPWVANNTIWNNQPEYITTNQVLLPTSDSAFQDYPNIDVTTLVRGMVSNPATNYGFALVLKTEAYHRCMNFSSGDAPNIGKRPLLTITYDNQVGIVQNSNTIPSEYKVYQNYPNPFNPNTKIKFDIPNSSFTVLTVYNELGKEIMNLVNQKVEAGSYEVDFNGTNLNSGIYFYTIRTGNFVETKKMILLK